MSTKIWYDKYDIGYDNIDDKWLRGFPLGNGRVAAMAYCRADTEIIGINEESLWSSRNIQDKYTYNPEALAKARRLISEKRYGEAVNIIKTDLAPTTHPMGFYEHLGELRVDFSDKSPIDNYYRELELCEAIARTSYTKSDAEYKSEVFVSAYYDALVYKIEATRKFSCNVSVFREKDAFCSATDGHNLLMRGQIIFSDPNNKADGGEGLEFGGRFHLVSDGVLSGRDTYVEVKNATYLIIYSAVATNYNVEKYDLDESISYKRITNEIIEKIKDVPYEEIKKRHIEDWQEKFLRSMLTLDAEAPKGRATDLRIELMRYQGVADDEFTSLYYNFGRYLLLSASGFNAKLPANLQGKWCHGIRPPWSSDYHMNINLQMNYWPCEVANMQETFKPYGHMIKKLSIFGESVARDLYGARGWTHMLCTNVFGKVAVAGASCGFYPVAGAWNCLNMWEHFEYSGDLEYLKEIFPIMKGSCLFFKDSLIERNGYLITSPSNSPEHDHFYIDPDSGEKKRTIITEGATMDIEIIHSLFIRALCACELLGDNEIRPEIEEVLSKLPPLRVSQYGTIAEWFEDFEETEPGHRHISHLYGLFPSDQINETDPVIFEAAKRTMDRRLSNGSGGTGWSLAWFVNFFARLKDGKSAFDCLYKMYRNFTYYNMFDLHPPYPLYQIDGNFGATAGIAEMLLQSHLGKPCERIIELLPALPDNWSGGKITGLRARGNFTLDITWKKGMLDTAEITSGNDNILRIKLNDRTKGLTSDKKYTVVDGVACFEMGKNEKIIIKNV